MSEYKKNSESAAKGRFQGSDRVSFLQTLRYNRPLINGILIVLLLAVLAAVLLIAGRFDRNAGQVDVQSGSIDGTTSTIRIEIPFFDKEQYLVGRGVIAYMESDLSEDVGMVLGEYRTSQPMDAGYPVILNFDITGMPAGYTVSALRVEVSEDTAFTAPRVIPLNVEDRSTSIYHLKTGTRYYFRIILTVSDGSEVFAQGTFQTADTPRILSIDGISNVRDLGGWNTIYGKKIRQGMIYRGSEMDGQTEESYRITESGKDVMLNVLGIKTEIDLRWNVPTEALGETVTKKTYAISMYNKLFEAESSERLRGLISELANPDIYPVYIHCSYGWDRTGTVVTVLGLLLGMEEEDIIREQELSALCHGGSNVEELEEFLSAIEQFPGNNLTEKVENYLLSLGVTREEIQSIRQILLTE